MPRNTISSVGFQELTQHDTNGAWVSFMGIGLHPRENDTTKLAMSQIAYPDGRVYVCSNNVRTKGPQSIINKNPVDDKLYTPFPFEVALANSNINREQTVTLSFDNIDRLLIDVLRQATYPLKIDFAIGVVLRVEFDVSGRNGTAYAEGFEMGVTDLELQNVSWNAQTITGTLTKDSVLQKAFPSNHPYYEFLNFPGLYGTQGRWI